MITTISHTHTKKNITVHVKHTQMDVDMRTHYSKIFWQSNYSWHAISVFTFTEVTSLVIVSH